MWFWPSGAHFLIGAKDRPWAPAEGLAQKGALGNVCGIRATGEKLLLVVPSTTGCVTFTSLSANPLWAPRFFICQRGGWSSQSPIPLPALTFLALWPAPRRGDPALAAILAPTLLLSPSSYPAQPGQGRGIQGTVIIVKRRV